MEPVRGQPLLRGRAVACLASDAGHVRAVLRPGDPDRLHALDGLDIEIVTTDGSENGLSHSIQTGLRGIASGQVLIMLADLPDITTEDLNRVLNAAHQTSCSVVRGANSAGKPGHPVVVKRALFADLMALTGDRGAQPVLSSYSHDTVLVSLPGDHALMDLDTPADWDRWRKL